MNARQKSSRFRRTARRRRVRGVRAALMAPMLCPSDAAAGAPAISPPATTSLGTLLARHVIRDGEIILLAIKPSLWFIFFGCLPAMAVATIMNISTRLWAPHHVHLAIEAGVLLVACRAAWAVLSWAGRLYLLTDLRVIRISGVFNPQIHDVPLRKIARTRVVRSFKERLWRLGSIEIIPESDQWPCSWWQTIARPTPVDETVRRAIARAKQGGCFSSRL